MIDPLSMRHLCFYSVLYACPFKFPLPFTIRSISSVVILSISALLYPSLSRYFSRLTDMSGEVYCILVFNLNTELRISGFPH